MNQVKNLTTKFTKALVMRKEEELTMKFREMLIYFALGCVFVILGQVFLAQPAVGDEHQPKSINLVKGDNESWSTTHSSIWANTIMIPFTVSPLTYTTDETGSGFSISFIEEIISVIVRFPFLNDLGFKAGLAEKPATVVQHKDDYLLFPIHIHYPIYSRPKELFSATYGGPTKARWPYISLFAGGSAMRWEEEETSIYTHVGINITPIT